MRLNIGCLVLAMLLAHGTQAAEIDCNNNEAYEGLLLDVLDTDAESAKRQQALQVMKEYAQCPEVAGQLGLLYRHGSELPGNLVQKDAQRATELLLQAAEAGRLMAYADLAEMALREGQGREAMKWTQVYLYFVKSRKSFDEYDRFARSGYNVYLLARADRAWRATKPRLQREWINTDFNQYLKDKEALVLTAINEVDATSGKAAAEQPESGELRIKAVHSCDLNVSVIGYASYLIEVQPDGHSGRTVLENFSPEPRIGEVLRKCAGVYEYHPFGGSKPKVVRVPVIAGYTYGPSLNFRGK